MIDMVFIFKHILYMGVSSSLIILIILLVKKIFNKTLTIKWHYYIWILLIIRLTTPFYIQGNVSINNFAYSLVEKVSVHNKFINNIKSTTTSFSKNNLADNPNIKINKALDKGVKTKVRNKVNVKSNGSILIKASFIWMLGLMLIFMYIIYLNIFVAVKIKNYKKSYDVRLNSILESCKEIMKVRKNISILTSKEARTPSLYGLFRVKILACESHMERLTDNEIKYVFLHELAHYKRKDIVFNWIIIILQSIYFFNPLIWYAFYKMREDCEVACDDLALEKLNHSEYKDYGRTVLKLLRFFSESNFIPLTAGLAKNKSSYKRRIIMISNFKKRKFIYTIGSVTLIALVGFVGFTKLTSSNDKNIKNSKVAVDKKINPIKKADTKSNNQTSNVNSSQDKNVAAATPAPAQTPVQPVSDKNNNTKTNSTNTNKQNQQNKKVVEVNTLSSTASKAENTTPKQQSNFYESQSLGIAITFPENWSGKYYVSESSGWLTVYCKGQKHDGELLWIHRNSPEITGQGYDTIDGKNVFTVGSADYFVGGPTGITIEEDDPNFKDFMTMHSQLPQVVNSMRAIK
ncbi:M56 family metallopeptidase [Clostridium felsineum]|uniref:M56 family metallopeptidase n=1 Tax=Clostridium felsineum TaxID=36839 RepID=UPI00214D85E9|nr:M56 family metallopeptidase [Clostridium felsineum]MCR3761485.1 M56 family metallopeptidase [Clostridium felsineum]